jgi:hypothetical protein
MQRRSAVEFTPSCLVDLLGKAGAKGLTLALLTRRAPAGIRSEIPAMLQKLQTRGAIRGPFRIARAQYYFSSADGPTREQAEARIEDILLKAGTAVTSRSGLKNKLKRFPELLFDEALSRLRSEGRIVELKGPKAIAYYVHCEPMLELLQGDAGANKKPRFAEPARALTLDELRPFYEALKAQQGGIGTVKIYDLWQRVGGSQADLHRLLLQEARDNHLTLHPASTVNFPREVMDSAIRLEGQPYPFVTVVLKEGA